MLGRQELPHQPGRLGRNRRELGDHRIGSRAERLGIERAHRTEFHLDPGFQHGLQIDQDVHPDGQDGRTRDPAKPAQRQPRHENLHHPQPVVLDVQQSPGQRNARDGIEFEARERQPPEQKAAEGDLLADRRDHDDGQEQWHEPARLRGGPPDLDLERRHEIAAADPEHGVECQIEGQNRDHRDDDFGALRHNEPEIQRGRPAPHLRGKDQHRDLHRHRREGAECDHHAVIIGDRTARPAGRPDAERNGCQHHAEKKRRQRPGQRCADAPRRVRAWIGRHGCRGSIRREAHGRFFKSLAGGCGRLRVGLFAAVDPAAERIALLVGHAGLVAQRHGPILHGLHIDLLGVAAHLGDAFQRHVLGRLLEGRMRRVLARGT